MEDGAKELAKGDHIRIRLVGDEDWCDGYVVYASTSAAGATTPQAVMLKLDGGVHGGGGVIAGGLPVTIDYAAGTVLSLFGEEYEIDVARPDAPS